MQRQQVFCCLIWKKCDLNSQLWASWFVAAFLKMTTQDTHRKQLSHSDNITAMLADPDIGFTPGTGRSLCSLWFAHLCKGGGFFEHVQLLGLVIYIIRDRKRSCGYYLSLLITLLRAFSCIPDIWYVLLFRKVVDVGTKHRETRSVSG